LVGTRDQCCRSPALAAHPLSFAGGGTMKPAPDASVARVAAGDDGAEAVGLQEAGVLGTVEEGRRTLRGATDTCSSGYDRRRSDPGNPPGWCKGRPGRRCLAPGGGRRLTREDSW
jgi:hypothetical protein